MTDSIEPRNPANLIPKRDGSIHSDLPVPPGEYLAEVLGKLGLEKTSLATQLSLSVGEVDALLTGSSPVTATIATQLEKTTSVSANIWLGLEAEYRLALAGAATDERQEVEFGGSSSL